LAVHTVREASRWRLRQSSVYEYVWFREAPHLRLPLVRENEMATVPVADLNGQRKEGGHAGERQSAKRRGLE